MSRVAVRRHGVQPVPRCTATQHVLPERLARQLFEVRSRGDARRSAAHLSTLTLSVGSTVLLMLRCGQLRRLASSRRAIGCNFRRRSRRAYIAARGHKLCPRQALAEDTETPKQEVTNSSSAEVRGKWLEGLVAQPAPDMLQLWLSTLSPDLLEVVSIIEGHGDGSERAWIVGGAVRDALSGIRPADVDIATTMKPEQLLAAFPNAIPTGEKYGVVTVRHKGATVECSVLRSSLGSCSDGRRSGEVIFGSNLLEDLSIRDFTINAMAVDPLRGLLFDPFGGYRDVMDGVIRAVSDPPSLMLRADGLRSMRAYRFLSKGRRADREHASAGDDAAKQAAEFWCLDDALANALQDSAPLLQPISCERICKELKQILSNPRAPEVVDLMVKHSILPTALRTPELEFQSEGKQLRALEAHWKDPEVVQALQYKLPDFLPLKDRPDPLSNPSPPVHAQPYDFYAFVDFEATCWDKEKGEWPHDGAMEIIELPVILIDAREGRLVGEFHTFVRPTIHPELSFYCEDLTGITQKQVDVAPTFSEACADMLKWLEGQVSGASVAFVTDGNWDFHWMLPRQWQQSYGAEVPLPPVFQSFVDIRDVFVKVHPQLRARRSGKLHKMCRSLAVEPEGPVHSGYADARNVARLGLALMADGGVLSPREEFSHETADADAASGQSAPRDVIYFNVEALTLLLGCASPKDVSRVCQELRLSKVETRFVTQHCQCLGVVPDANDHGEVRRFVSAFGESWAEAHWRLERAWAQSHDDPEERVAARARVDAAMQVAQTLRPGSVAPRPVVNGRWLMEKTGLPACGKLGRVKEWVYYEQVQRDLQTPDEIESLLSELPWEETPIHKMPMVTWPPGKQERLRKTALQRVVSS